MTFAVLDDHYFKYAQNFAPRRNGNFILTLQEFQ